MSKALTYVREKYFSSKIWKSEWVLVIIIAIAAFACFCYTDSRSYAVWTGNVLDSIYDGNLRDFYLISHENLHGADHLRVGGEIFSLIPWAIWNIPIWLFQRFGGIEIISSPWMLAWSKLFLVFALVLCLVFAYKICMLLTESKNKSIMAVFLSATSLTVFMGIYFAGQNDIVVGLFGVIAIYALLKNKKFWFYFFIACGVVVKPFILFPYIALILLMEKNILKAFLKIIPAFGMQLLCKLIFTGAPMYAESLAAGPMNREIANILGPSFQSGQGAASFFIVAFVIVCFVCYVKQIDLKNKKELGTYAIYIFSVMYLVFMAMTKQAYYRSPILVPFIYIMFMVNSDRARLSTILDTIGMTVYSVAHLMISSFYLQLRWMDKSIMSALFGTPANADRAYKSVIALVTRFVPDLEAYKNALSGVFYICCILIIVINYPGFKFKSQRADKLLTNPEDKPVERWIIWLRILAPLGFLAMAVFCYYRLKLNV